MGALDGRVVVVGVTGGIAAYKACEFVRELVKLGAEVHVILTESGARFVTPLTLQTLSKNPVATGLFDLAREAEIGHIALAQRAHLLAIVPATANIIGKIRAGIADDLLSTVVTATAAPVLLAPAMNSQMYASAAVQENLAVLRSRGFHLVEPDEWELACGTVGPGRLADLPKIVEAARIVLSEKPLAGRRVVVSAGPTAEEIDPVRVLTNRSSGKMGFAMARAARRMGAAVTLVAGPAALPDPFFVETVRVRSAEEMREAVLASARGADVVVMCAAVADFRPAERSAHKIRKEAFANRIDLVRTPDILEELGAQKGGRILVGFAAETADAERNALEKMRRKRLDAIAVNDVGRPGIGFGSDRNEVRLFFASGECVHLPEDTKEVVAEGIWRALCARLLVAGA